MKILLTGAKGMLAYDFQKYCGNDFEIVAVDKQKLNITEIKNVELKIKEIQPEVIVNCAAYTNVDEAEDSGKLLNFWVNTVGVHNLAKAAKEVGCDLITISTDYVFDGLCHPEGNEGSSQSGYLPNDPCNPLNSYGMAKYLGEELAKIELPSTIIIRTSRLYGGGSAFKNFPNTMIKLSETRNEIKVVNDQFGLPTSTKDLSLAIKEVINQIEKCRGQIFHFSNSGTESISWFDFAEEIFRLTKKKITILPCSSSEFPTKAKRPKFSCLLNESEIQLRDWREGLREYITSCI